MLDESFTAKVFLTKKFGSMDKTPPGVYAIPKNTAVSESFMRVVVAEDHSLSDFTMYMDDEFKEKWEDVVQRYIPKKF